MQMSFEDLEDNLGPEAVELFMQMASLHVATSGDRIFIDADDVLIFAGGGLPGPQPNLPFDGGALRDLIDHNLLHVEHSGGTGYRIKGPSVRFHRWLLAKSGAPVAEVEAQVRRLVDDVSFAAKHAGAAHHLTEAFDLLWSERVDLQTTSEIGDHLRKAIMDVTTDVVGADGGNAEQPIVRLRAFLAASNLLERERLALTRLVELAEATLRLDHRVNHVRDEVDQGEPPPSRAELRRAGFLTAFVCYELAALG